MKDQYAVVEYHSRLWENLVELGWLTYTVETVGSIRLATMINPATRKR